MQNLSLSDVAWIFGSLIVFALVCVGGRPAWHLARALKRRYVCVSWQGLLDMLADEGVSDFDSDAPLVGRALIPLAGKPPLNMSSTRPVSTRVDTDTAGIAPGITLDIAQLAHDLTEDQLLELLLRRKRANGEWRFSGKKLFTVWGGNYNAFVARSMAVRADDDPPEEPLVPTPIAGRPTKASYYPDDLDLEYQSPPR